MRKFGSKACLTILCSLMLSVVIGAQKTPGSKSSQPSSPSTSGSNGNATGTTTGAPAGRQTPCWQQAGISKEAMEQRRNLEQEAKSQIAAVCSDTALTAEQKREKIKAIHQQTQQQVQGLITQQQQEALKSCQASRQGAHPGNGGGPHPGAGMGPCGEMPSGSGQPSAGTSSQPKN